MFTSYLFYIQNKVFDTCDKVEFSFFAYLCIHKEQFNQLIININHKMTRYRMILSLLLAGMGTTYAQNPIVQTQLTTDPAPLVVGDRL